MLWVPVSPFVSRSPLGRDNGIRLSEEELLKRYLKRRLLPNGPRITAYRVLINFEVEKRNTSGASGRVCPCHASRVFEKVGLLLARSFIRRCQKERSRHFLLPRVSPKHRANVPLEVSSLLFFFFFTTVLLPVVFICLLLVNSQPRKTGSSSNSIELTFYDLSLFLATLLSCGLSSAL